MSLAAQKADPGSDRLERFRGLRARLDPAGDPARAFADELYVPQARSVSARIAAELALSPVSTHLLVGGVGSGKTTELFAVRDRLNRIQDTRAFYIDVSKGQDINRMSPGEIAVQVGIALGHHVDDSLERIKALFDARSATSKHVVVLLDGLDRLTDMPAFEQIIEHDLNALTSIAIGVVLVGPLRALYGIERTVTLRFDGFHYQPWMDLATGSEAGSFLTNVLTKRVPEDAIERHGIEALVRASGGVLRDLLALAQSACVEAYIGGSDVIGEAEAASAIDAFARKHMQGLRPAEIEVLERVRTKGTFVQTSEDDLALLMTRRVLEYRNNGRPRYAVHPTIEPFLREMTTG